MELEYICGTNPPNTNFMHAYYRKPAEICHFDAHYETLTTREQMLAFADTEHARMDAYLASHGFRMRTATLEDIPAIRSLMAELFNAAAQKSAGELYKMIRFGGYTIVVEDLNAANEIIGFDLCTCYHGEFRMALGNMVGVSLRYGGKKLGLVLEQYSFIGNMKMDMLVRGGGVKPNNYNSMHMLFNQVGYLGEVYLSGQLGSKEPRILLAYPITPGGYMNNRIDLQKVDAYMSHHTQGKDWQTVLCEDFDAVEAMYKTSSFRVVAFLPKGIAAEENMLFALPEEILHFPAEQR